MDKKYNELNDTQVNQVSGGGIPRHVEERLVRERVEKGMCCKLFCPNPAVGGNVKYAQYCEKCRKSRLDNDEKMIKILEKIK